MSDTTQCLDWADEVSRQELRGLMVRQLLGPTNDGGDDTVAHDVTPAEGKT